MIIYVKSVGDGLSPVFGTAASISLGMNIVDGTAAGGATVGKEATVSYLLTHTQCFVTELTHRAANVEYGYNSTHIIYIYKVGCLWTIAGVSSSDAVIL